MKTLFDDQLMDELKAEVERRRCPECGAHVFIHNLQDFTTFIGEMQRGNFGVVGVYCSDMGHWAGYLHECFPQTEEDKAAQMKAAQVKVMQLQAEINREKQISAGVGMTSSG